MTTLRAPAAVPALARSLWDPQAEVRVEAIRAIGLIDDDTVLAILIEALRDPEVRVREMAADALTRWHSPGVAMRLASALASPDLRRSAGEVLERMGGIAVEALIEVAAEGDMEAARSAGSLLDRITGPRPFVDRLASIEPDQRLRAVQVLAAMGGPTACDALVSALADPDIRVRSRAATALGVLEYLPALKALRRMFLTDPVSEAASAAEDALRALGAVREEEPPPQEESPLPDQELHDHPEKVGRPRSNSNPSPNDAGRLAAYPPLMERTPRRPGLGLAELLEALASPDPAVRAAAIARTRPQPAMQGVLLGSLADPAPEVRAAAVRAVSRLEGRRVAEALIEVSSGDVSVLVRAEAVAAIGRILEARTRGREHGPRP
jgi:HEAT repeat protein